MAGVTQPPGEPQGGVLERMDKRAFARMETRTHEFLSQWAPMVTEFGNRAPGLDAMMAADLVGFEYRNLLEEALKVTRSLEEFSRFAAGDALLIVLARIRSFGFLGGLAREEAEQGLLLRYMNAPVFDEEEEPNEEGKGEPYRVGFLTARALAQAFLEWRALAWRAVAEGALPEREEEGAPSGVQEATQDNKPGFVRRAAWLAEQIQRRKLSQNWFEERRGGPDKKTIRKILRGEPVSPKTLRTLAEALGVSPDDIPHD